MPRYRRYRRTIVRAPKKKWATNIISLNGGVETGTGNGHFSFWKMLAENKTETSSPIPVIVKTGNFKVQFDMIMNVGSSGVISASAFVLFIPQGVLTETTANYDTVESVVKNHPEWIMSWRQLDFGNANQAGSVDTSVVKFSSRMKRNLNSGDAVVFTILGTGDFSGVSFKSSVNGMAQFWTCAN